MDLLARLPAAASRSRLEPLLDSVGKVFRRFLRQDSDCVSYGLEVGGARWFVKGARGPAGRASLGRAEAFHGAVRHAAIVPLAGTFETAEGRALVYPWVPGELLYHPAEPGAGAGGRARFQALGLAEVLAACAAVLDAHRAVAAAGFVAVDLYDGCFLYDFEAARMRLVDLDEYRPGPFRVEGERLPGSRRFMAPEEFVRGATIDARTTVFGLGRAARVLLTDPAGAWRGGPARAAVLARACRPDPAARYRDPAGLADAWARAGRAEGRLTKPPPPVPGRSGRRPPPPGS